MHTKIWKGYIATRLGKIKILLLQKRTSTRRALLNLPSSLQYTLFEINFVKSINTKPTYKFDREHFIPHLRFKLLMFAVISNQVTEYITLLVWNVQIIIVV